MVTVDGGTGYWNPHPGDDPMAMVVDELIPMCQQLGLGRGRDDRRRWGSRWADTGLLLLAEKYPGLVGAVAAISPAIWTSYEQARAVNARGLRFRRGLRRRRRRHPCRRPRPHTRTGRFGSRRSFPPRRQGPDALTARRWWSSRRAATPGTSSTPRNHRRCNSSAITWSESHLSWAVATGGSASVEPWR